LVAFVVGWSVACTLGAVLFAVLPSLRLLGSMLLVGTRCTRRAHSVGVFARVRCACLLGEPLVQRALPPPLPPPGAFLRPWAASPQLRAWLCARPARPPWPPSTQRLRTSRSWTSCAPGTRSSLRGPAPRWAAGLLALAWAPVAAGGGGCLLGTHWCCGAAPPAPQPGPGRSTCPHPHVLQPLRPPPPRARAPVGSSCRPAAQGLRSQGSAHTRAPCPRRSCWARALARPRSASSAGRTAARGTTATSGAAPSPTTTGPRAR
jgi:hypothetical protein